MAKKTTNEKKSILASWFFKQPAKFALLSFGLMLGIALAYSLIYAAIFGTTQIAAEPIAILLLAAVIFSICKLVGWLPKNDLDRRSFVAIDNGLGLLYTGFMLASVILAISIFGGNSMQILFYVMWLQSYSMGLFLVLSTVGSLVYLYVFGLLIAMIYSMYKRAIAMGIPKWKAVLSVPLGLSLIWFPGYMLSDDKKTTPTTPIKSKWFATLTDWIVAKPINTVLAFFAMFAIALPIMDLNTLFLVAGFVAIFGVWVSITGAAKLRKNVGGAFATVAVILNVLLIVGTIGFAWYAANNLSNVNDVQVEIIETSETVITE